MEAGTQDRSSPDPVRGRKPKVQPRVQHILNRVLENRVMDDKFQTEYTTQVTWGDGSTSTVRILVDTGCQTEMLVREGLAPATYTAEQPLTFVTADGKTSLKGGSTQASCKIHFNGIIYGSESGPHETREIIVTGTPYEVGIKDWDILIGHSALYHMCMQHCPRYNMCQLHLPWPAYFLKNFENDKKSETEPLVLTKVAGDVRPDMDLDYTTLPQHNNVRIVGALPIRDPRHIVGDRMQVRGVRCICAQEPIEWYGRPCEICLESNSCMDNRLRDPGTIGITEPTSEDHPLHATEVKVCRIRGYDPTPDRKKPRKTGMREKEFRLSHRWKSKICTYFGQKTGWHKREMGVSPEGIKSLVATEKFKNKTVFLNPPESQLQETIRILRGTRAKAILVVPRKPSADWWGDVMEVTIESLLLPSKHTGVCIHVDESGLLHQQPGWDTIACHIDTRILYDQSEQDPDTTYASRKTPCVPTSKKCGPDWLRDEDDPEALADIRERIAKAEKAIQDGTAKLRGIKVRSLIQHEGSYDSPLANGIREKIIAGYSKDVLSGEVSYEKTVAFDRGPLGTSKIHLKESTIPKSQRGFRMVGAKEAAIREITEEFIERGWIEECIDGSAWASNAFVVPKKDTGKFRLVIDYRYLNTCTQPDAHPMPLIDDIIQKQSGNTIFTIIDMKKGFHQMFLHPEDRHLTAMNIGGKRYQWRVMPMGITNGPPQFQKMMDKVLEGLDCCQCYVDDILIGSRGDTEAELLENHRKDVESVLQRMRQYGLVAEVSKTAFFARRVEFCGHILEGGARRPQEGKLVAIENYSAPTTLKELRSFLGLCNYYSGYVRDYAELAAPLMDMLKGITKDGDLKSSKIKLTKWGLEQERSFLDLKRALTTAVPVQLMDQKKPVYLSPDASDFAVGVAMQQKGCECPLDKESIPTCRCALRPVALYSRKLASAQLNWTVKEKECYAIVIGLKKWDHYLRVSPFPILVETDHKAIVSWHKEVVDIPGGPTGRQARWHELFSAYRLVVTHLQGVLNHVGDWLSRWAYPAKPDIEDVGIHGNMGAHIEVEAMVKEEREKNREALKLNALIIRPIQVNELSVPTVFMMDWTSQYMECKQFKHHWHNAQNGVFDDHTRLYKDKLVRNGRWCVPTGLQGRVAQEFHDLIHITTSGLDKHWTHLKTRCMGQGLREACQTVHNNCAVCRIHTPPNTTPEGLLKSAPVPLKPMDFIALDFFSYPLVEFDGLNFDQIMLVICQLSGYALAIPGLKKGQSSEQTARALANYWLDGFGVPTFILSDKGPQFTGAWWDTLCAALGIVHATAITNRHQGNGKAEVTGKGLRQALAKARSVDPSLTWRELCRSVVRQWNATPGPTGLSPHEIVFGRVPGMLGPAYATTRAHPDATNFLKERAEADAKARELLLKSREQRSGQYNKGRREAVHKYKKGDWVWLRQLRSGLDDKNEPYWEGPVEVTRVVGKDLYEIRVKDLNDAYRLTDYTADCLWPYPQIRGRTVELHYTQQLAKERRIADTVPDYEVDHIIGHDLINGVYKFHVRWKGYESNWDTWEPPEQFLPGINTLWRDYCKKHKLPIKVTDHSGNARR